MPYRVKEPGFLGGTQRKLKKKAFGSVSCFLFEKTDGAHIFCNACGTESKSRGFTALFATKEFWSVCTFC